MSSPSILVTGASGYVGGRLVPALLDRGATVRCLARTPSKLDAALWREAVEVVQGEASGDLSAAMRDVDVAVYLIHSIGQGDGWVAQEQRDSESFSRAAATAGVRRIVFLGGLGRDDDQLSDHLRSRHEVGRILASSGVEVIELRAGVIIGSGSASFEMLRYLVEVLPVMVTPKWVSTKCQPIAINDTIEVLAGATLAPEHSGGVFELGGNDVVSYAEMMATYASVAGLPRRWLIPVPLLTPWLSAHWVGLVTPVPVPLARELVESLVNEVTVSGESACKRFAVSPLGLREAISRALAATQDGNVPTSFTDADLAMFRPTSTDPRWSGGTELCDVRSTHTEAGVGAVFGALEEIGEAKGWYSAKWLWRLRGVLDQLVGGPGLRRGRREVLTVGDALDFWRVAEIVPDRRLRLHAEMRMPGEAWLTWDLEGDPSGTTIVQTANFRPRGLLGRLYWLAVAPFHRFVFPGMLMGIVQEAESSRTPRGA
jgi:uncharacterized protein YbjT (DUF2867 family)